MLSCRPMEELLKWRRERLAALVKEMGSSGELGKALGHKSGTQVRAMIAGLRVLSNATMDEIEALPGRAGWFGRNQSPSEDRQLAILECLRFQREFLELLPPVSSEMAKVALKRFIDHPEEILEVAQSLQALSAER